MRPAKQHWLPAPLILRYQKLPSLKCLKRKVKDFSSLRLALPHCLHGSRMQRAQGLLLGPKSLIPSPWAPSSSAQCGTDPSTSRVAGKAIVAYSLALTMGYFVAYRERFLWGVSLLGDPHG